MDISRIKNETLHKLTWEEIGTLGLLNEGIVTYRGTLKARAKGYKTEVINEWQTNFIGEFFRVEFIKIQQTSTDRTDYAMRTVDLETNEYFKAFNIMAGLKFLK